MARDDDQPGDRLFGNGLYDDTFYEDALYDDVPGDDEPGNDRYEDLLQEIAKRSLALVGAYGNALHREHPDCGLKLRRLIGIGERATLNALLETPRAVKAVLSVSTLALIVAGVGWKAMAAAATRERATGFDDDLDLARAVLLADLITARIAEAADKLLKEFPTCGLSLLELHDAGSDSALQAMIELPPPMIAILGDSTIAKICGMVGWNKAFDEIDLALSRGPPGRRMPDD